MDKKKISPKPDTRAISSQSFSKPEKLAGAVNVSRNSEVLRPALQFSWARTISAQQWRIYRRAIQTIREADIPFLLGGGFALATYTGRWRDTKDIDFYIRPQDRQAVVDALTRAGFADYYSRLRYDRKWIYRSVQSDVIVDMIWAMANQRARVDPLWFEHAGSVSIRGEHVAVIPLEEFIWCKLYIVQRDHCDWTDLFNLLHVAGRRVNWNHLLERLDEDRPLLRGLLSVYGWLCPKRAQQLPEYLWRVLEMPRPASHPRPKRDHIRLLDSRAWFGPSHPKATKLEV